MATTSIQNGTRPHMTTTKSTMASASGLLSMLTEPSPPLVHAALTRLLTVVDTLWHEVAHSLPDLEALAEDSSVDLATRQIAAAVASRVFFHLEEPTQALRLALESGEGNGFDVVKGKKSAYVECLVGAAIEAYVTKKRAANEDAAASAPPSGEAKKEEVDEEGAGSELDMEKLSTVVHLMFERCYVDGTYGHALGVAFEARETEKVKEILDACVERCDATKVQEVLGYALNAATTLVSSKLFRNSVLEIVAQHLQRLVDSQAGDFIRKASAVSLCQAQQILKNPEPVSTIVSSLLDGKEEEGLLGLQLCFDLMDSGDDSFVTAVAASLPTKTEENASTKTDEIWKRYDNATRILIGGFSSELALSFLHKNSDSDKLIMENLKRSLEERGAGRNSVLHNCAVVTHSYLNAGTTNDAFLRDHLDWMRKASNWAKFSATASLGVVHAGHTTEAMSLLEPYLPASPNADDPSGATPVSTTGGYAEGGSLYALGIIHGSYAGSSSTKRKETNDFLRNHLRNSHANEVISHGAALGVGLTAFGTNNLEVVNELKELLFTDSAVAGEAAGMAIGMVLVGSGAGNLHSSIAPSDADEMSEIITELKNYARETQHEKIIRGVAMGIALVNYGQEENADAVIDEMRADRDPILRYGAQYALALAYCGTGSNKAIRILLHTAVSDVSDDVRMAAVIALAFVLYKTPERVPQLVKLLLESFNPHVRYASCMAVGIAMAGTGDADSVALLEPMLTDMTDFVRQGALLGTAMIYMQQGDVCNGKKIKSFREKLASTGSDKHQSTLTKMGAILSTGLIDAGGRNCSLDLGSRNGFTKMTSAVGLTLWLQHWHWFPMMHMLSLALTPTFTIGLNKDFKYPKNFQIQCNSKPSLFAYPKRLEEKKQEKKKRVETVTLSTTAKNKARLARKRAKEETDTGIAPMDEDGNEEKSKEKEETGESMEVDGDGEAGETAEDKKIKKKREPESTSFRLSNPCRITKAQAEVCAYDLGQRYRPIRPEAKPCGVIMLTDSTPGDEEDLGTVKAPSIESEDEADAPEPFEWAPPGHPDAESSNRNTDESAPAPTNENMTSPPAASE